ncbi:hypothetical protein FOL47_003082, partial [Perkinsus chesapeaki]
MVRCALPTPYSVASMGFFVNMVLVLSSILSVSSGNPFSDLTPFFLGVTSRPHSRRFSATARPSRDANVMYVVVKSFSNDTSKGFHLKYDEQVISREGSEQFLLNLDHDPETGRFSRFLQEMVFTDNILSVNPFFTLGHDTTSRMTLTLIAGNATLALYPYYCPELDTAFHPCINGDP